MCYSYVRLILTLVGSGPMQASLSTGECIYAVLDKSSIKKFKDEIKQALQLSLAARLSCMLYRINLAV